MTFCVKFCVSCMKLFTFQFIHFACARFTYRTLYTNKQTRIHNNGSCARGPEFIRNKLHGIENVCVSCSFCRWTVIVFDLLMLHSTMHRILVLLFFVSLGDFMHALTCRSSHNIFQICIYQFCIDVQSKLSSITLLWNGLKKRWPLLLLVVICFFLHIVAFSKALQLSWPKFCQMLPVDVQLAKNDYNLTVKTWFFFCSWHNMSIGSVSGLWIKWINCKWA